MADDTTAHGKSSLTSLHLINGALTQWYNHALSYHSKFYEVTKVLPRAPIFSVASS